MRNVHREMVDAGDVVQIPESTTELVGQSYPDLRTMKKSERTPILRQKMNELKASLRQFLNGLKGGSYEFEVNGNVLEAKLYDTGVKEVMEKITQDKASMLYHSEQVFQNARYLYSTPDYEGNPNIYRWNYFYTPVQIGEKTVGVRIAVRDMVPSADGRMDSQIYNWNIKKDAVLGDGRPGQSPNTTDASSTAPIDAALDGERPSTRPPSFGVSSAASSATTVPQPAQGVKNQFAQNGAGTAQAANTGENREAGPIRQFVQKQLDAGTRSFPDIVRNANTEGLDAGALVEAVNRGEYGINSKGELFVPTAEDHIDNRDISSVGDRKVRAFQFDYPQLHQYFVEAAWSLKSDLANTTRGERFYAPGTADSDLPMEGAWTGTKRSTTEGIATLKDDWRLSYEDIEKAADAIIHNKGQENYAAAKRVEIILDDMLTNGYRDPTGFFIPANEEYKQAKSKILGAAAEDTTETEADELPLPEYLRETEEKARQAGQSAEGQQEQLTSAENMNRYKSVIDSVFTGGLPSGSDIVVGETPPILRQYGAPDLNLHMSQSTARKIAYPDGYMGGKHNLGMSALKNLPYQIADPLAILNSKTQPNSLVVITEWKTQDGQDVIVPIHLNKQGAMEAGNSIASAYGKGNIDAILGENGENILYTKNNEDIHQLLSNGLQLPEAMADDVLAGNSVSQNSGDVNTQNGRSGAEQRGQTPYVDAQGEPIGPESSVGAAAHGFDPYSNMISEYGIIPEGEKPARIVDVPKSTNGKDRVSWSARTVLEAKATPDDMLGDIGDAVLSGALSHEVATDDAATANARNTIEDKGFDGAKESFHQLAKKGIVSKDAVALGQALLNNAMNAGDHKAAIDILTDYASMSTTAAQSLQAQRILKKLTPEGQLYGIGRTVKNLQEELKKRYGDKAPDLEVPEDLAQKFLDAENQDERDKIMDDIYKSIAAQTPATWSDKWNAWRYMAMLTNPRTHVRNIVGNAGFAPVRLIKNALATAMEAGVDYLSPNGIQRTKAALNPASKTDRALVKAALEDVKNVEEQLLSNGKYVDSGTGKIEEYRTIFKLKPLEAVRKGNSTAMDVEDTWFSKPAYAGALAGYLKANNATLESANPELLDQARSYAIREAQRATYRDVNAFSALVRNARVNTNRNTTGTKAEKALRNVLNVGVEGVLPFRATPANILMRGVEYSPAGLVKGLTYDLVQVRKGNKSAAQAIDGIAAGLTGTGLLALGALLASLGLVTGGGSGNDEQDEQNDLTGGQDYAVSIGKHNFTLDWLAPEALPFFVGVEAYNTLSDKSEGGVTWENISDAMLRITDPMLEMSMLQGVQDVIDNVRYADGGTLPKVAANAAISYLTQAVPTLFGQIERTTENQRYSTFIDKTSGIPSDLQYTIGSVMNKLPFEYNQIPYIDAWGRTEETGSLPERAVNNFLNPSYVSTEQTTEADREIQRLLDAGQAGVAPSRTAQSYQVTYKVDPEDDSSQKRYLSADEYVEYATVKGQTSYDVVSAMIESELYQDMTDEQKADAIKRAYSYAAHLAAEEVTDGKHESETYAELAQTAQEDLGLSEAEYLLLYEIYGSSINSDKVREAYQKGIDPEDYLEYAAGKSAYNEDGTGSLTIAENAQAIQASGLSEEEQELMWLVTYPDWAEKAEEKGVSTSTYIKYKVATYGSTKKADKLAALWEAGFSTAEAARLYRQIG